MANLVSSGNTQLDKHQPMASSSGFKAIALHRDSLVEKVVVAMVLAPLTLIKVKPGLVVANKDQIIFHFQCASPTNLL